MKKFYKLLKAMLSQDMNMFKYSLGKNASKIKKVMFPVFLGTLMMIAVGSYAYMFAEPLNAIGLTYVMLTLFMVTITITTFMEGIYKAQGILFECKDNNLLFSLPVEKTKIFGLRVLKLLIFQFIYNLFFMLPAYVVYVFFEKPDMSFYLISFLMLFLLPIIPTMVAVILGYMVKAISVKFKAKKIVQTLLSIVIFLGVLFVSYNIENFIGNLVQNAISINEFLTKMYFPIGAYINLIQKFEILELLKLLAVNIIPLVVVIYIGSVKYFKIISKTNEGSISISKLNNVEKIKVRTPIKSLVKKELTRYFSSPVYMFNTSFGLFILLIAVIGLSINSSKIIEMVIKANEIGVNIEDVNLILPKIYMQLIIFVGCMTSITSSSISLEGKSFNITKSLPIQEEKILFSKIIASHVICLPLMIISDLIFVIRFNVNADDIVAIFLLTLLVPTFTALLGLLINLKYPKMNATSDIEIVKQSMSTFISVFLGISIFGVSTGVMIKWFDNINNVLPIESVIFLIAIGVLWRILKVYGKKRIREINV